MSFIFLWIKTQLGDWFLRKLPCTPTILSNPQFRLIFFPQRGHGSIADLE
jgi:hypothetical protein